MRTTTLLATAVIAAMFAGIGKPVEAATPFPEYNAQRGLGVINVLPAWDKATGMGIVIAIVDSGVRLTHEDLKSQLVSTGYDFVNHDNFANDDSISGHGTGLAGVAAAARNGVGIVGVAYDAKILPVKVRNAQRVREPDLTTLGIDYATTHGANVINLSLPGDFKENIADAIQRATDAGVIVTMAAGNVAGGGPEFPAYLVGNTTTGGANLLKGRAIAVGAWDVAKNDIASFSNRAGSRMDYYLLAPGAAVVTTSNKSDHAYQAMGGTSFAAPAVAGAAALLLQLFPNIAPETVVQILLDTATDKGAPGVDEVYGHGLLNVGAAVSPQGNIAVPGSGGGSDNGTAIAVGALVLGGAVGYAILHHSKDAQQALILDKYGRGYSIDLAKATTVRDPQTDLVGLVQNMDREFNGLTMPISGNLTAHLYYSTPRESIYRSMSPEERARLADDLSDNPSQDVAFELSGKMGSALHYSLGFNMDPHQQFGNADEMHASGVQFLSNRSFGTSYLGFAQTANTLHLSYDPGKALTFNFGYNEMQTPDAHGLDSKAVLFQGDWQASRRMKVGLQLGLLKEDGNLFGSSSNNVWGVGSTDTMSLGLNGSYHITSNTRLIANYAVGYSHVNSMTNGILKDFSAVRSDAYGVGLMSDGVFRRHDTVGLAWSQPLRATAGTATLDLPIGIDAQNHIHRDAQRISLTPPGREQDIEAMYAMDIGPRSRLGAHLLYQHDPQNNNAAGDAVALLFTLRSSF